MSSETFLNISGISAGYARHHVIKNISIDIKAGETFGLIGLNGAGKTTLLKTILGLKDPEEGTISVANFPTGSSAAQKLIAYLPERFDPPWFLNAYEFIDFTLALYNQKASRPQMNEMADKLGLQTSFLSKRAKSYSKGMRQKLGLMTAFMTDCPLLILDEPMSGLDPLARAQVKDIMISQRKSGRTIFLSSHILSDMEELCDRVAVLHAGVIMFIGKPSDLVKESGQSGLERAFLTLTGLQKNQAA